MSSSPTPSSSKPSSITAKSSSPSYIHTGIGGIGNYRKSSTTSLESSSASTPNHKASILLPASSGIGGYGNHQNTRHTSSVVVSDDGELLREPRVTVAAYRGIGGVGNRNVGKELRGEGKMISGAERIRAKAASVFG